MINIHTNLLKEVNESEMWLLLHISKYFGGANGKSSFPSNKTLLSLTGWGIDKLRSVKSSLEVKNIIKIKHRFTDDRQTSNIYQVKTNYISFYSKPNDEDIEDTPSRKNQQGGGRKNQQGGDGENQPLPQSEKPTPIKYYKKEVLKEEVLKEDLVFSAVNKPSVSHGGFPSLLHQ